MESKKIMQMNVYAKQKQSHRYRKQTWLLKGRLKGGGTNYVFGLTDTNYYV